MRGGGKAHAAVLRGARQRECTGSDRERWAAEGRYRQRQGEVGGQGRASASRGVRLREGIVYNGLKKNAV